MDIYRKRKDFIQDFIPVFKQYFSIISNNREMVDITYESQLHDKTLDKLLKESFEKDKILRYTTTGIHKDDLSFGINSYPLKRFGSQGQQKSFIIAIKLAQFDYTKNIKGFKPILLFDDIFDKLDETRVTQLIQLVSQDSFGQVVITDTQYDRIKKLTNSLAATYHVWEIEAGILNLINSLRHD